VNKTEKAQTKIQDKGVHRFMLNLKPDLYDWVRAMAFHDRSSMSRKINAILLDAHTRVLEQESKS
jgi:hypothetical protein